jgi:hypothetical protein
MHKDKQIRKITLPARLVIGQLLFLWFPLRLPRQAVKTSYGAGDKMSNRGKPAERLFFSTKPPAFKRMPGRTVAWKHWAFPDGASFSLSRHPARLALHFRHDPGRDQLADVPIPVVYTLAMISASTFFMSTSLL